MKDFLRESFSYWGIYHKMHHTGRPFHPQKVRFGTDEQQYFLLYEPKHAVSGKVIVWVHGGGWNAGSPDDFDFVGQRVAKEGCRFVSLGYRLSPRHKYPCQIEDVCAGYKAAMAFLKQKGIDTSQVIVSGPSAGAHLSSILCYSRKIQQKTGIDVGNVIGYIGMGGIYSFSAGSSRAVKILLDQLFEKGYDRALGEPCSLIEESRIPMLLIQSRHDGLVAYACAEQFCEKAKALGIDCQLYSVTDAKNTHSWYTAGVFLFERQESDTLDTFFRWIEQTK